MDLIRKNKMRKLIVILGVIVCMVVSGCGGEFSKMSVYSKSTKSVNENKTSYTFTLKFGRRVGGNECNEYTVISVSKETYEKYSVGELIMGVDDQNNAK